MTSRLRESSSRRVGKVAFAEENGGANESGACLRGVCLWGACLRMSTLQFE